MLRDRLTDGRAGEGPSPFFMSISISEIEEGPMATWSKTAIYGRALTDAVKQRATDQRGGW